MKALLFNYRILFVVMITGIFMMDADVAFGQTASNGGCALAPTATGTCTFTVGSGATSSGDNSISIGVGSKGGSSISDYGFSFGSAAYAQGENSVAIGIGVGTDSTSEYNIVIGSKGAANFFNTIDHSIMLGTKLGGANPPTLYLEDPDLSSQSFGNVGIGTVAPESRLHVYDTARVGVASTANGSLVFNNSTNANTVTFKSGETTTTHKYTLPLFG
jgi:hypothetical protein